MCAHRYNLSIPSHPASEARLHVIPGESSKKFCSVLREPVDLLSRSSPVFNTCRLIHPGIVVAYGTQLYTLFTRLISIWIGVKLTFAFRYCLTPNLAVFFILLSFILFSTLHTERSLSMNLNNSSQHFNSFCSNSASVSASISSFMCVDKLFCLCHSLSTPPQHTRTKKVAS